MPSPLKQSYQLQNKVRVAVLGGGTIARLVLEQSRAGQLPRVEFVALSGRSAGSRGAALRPPLITRQPPHLDLPHPRRTRTHHPSPLPHPHPRQSSAPDPPRASP